jgi:hypothetical protein
VRKASTSVGWGLALLSRLRANTAGSRSWRCARSGVAVV